MQKFHPIKFALLILLLLTPSITFAIEWDFMFSQKAYSKHLTIQTRVATKEALSKLISDKNEDLSAIHKETNSELVGKHGRPTYLFVRIQNTGDLAAWGKLSCSVNDRRPLKFDVPSLAADMSDWNPYIITMSGVLFSNDEKNDFPSVKCSWDKLYAK